MEKIENELNECNKKIEIIVQPDLIMDTDDWEHSKKASGEFLLFFSVVFLALFDTQFAEIYTKAQNKKNSVSEVEKKNK